MRLLHYHENLSCYYSIWLGKNIANNKTEQFDQNMLTSEIEFRSFDLAEALLKPSLNIQKHQILIIPIYLRY